VVEEGAPPAPPFPPPPPPPQAEALGTAQKTKINTRNNISELLRKKVLIYPPLSERQMKQIKFSRFFSLLTNNNTRSGLKLDKPL
jgi:hypothetical protein